MMVAHTFEILEKLFASEVVVTKSMINLGKKLVKEDEEFKKRGGFSKINKTNYYWATNLFNGEFSIRELELLRHLKINPGDPLSYQRLRGYCSAMQKVLGYSPIRYLWVPTETTDERENQKLIDFYRNITSVPIPDFLGGSEEDQDPHWVRTAIVGVSLQEERPLSPLELCTMLGIDYNLIKNHAHLGG